MRFTVIRWALSALLAFASLAQANLATFTGLVVGIHDGDSLTILIDRQQTKIRLADIDAPELKQPFGTRSRQSLADLCFQAVAVVRPIGPDRYGRLLAGVQCNGIDANSAQIERGMAWVYGEKRGITAPLYLLQDKAQRRRRGLWQDASPVEPRRWRQSVARDQRLKSTP